MQILEHNIVGLGGGFIVLVLLSLTSTEAFHQPIPHRQQQYHAFVRHNTLKTPPAFIAPSSSSSVHTILFSTRSSSNYAPPSATATAYFYQVLGVTRDATVAQIKTAYRTLAKEFHPDANVHRHEDTTILFQNVNRAYEVVLEEVRNRNEVEQQQQKEEDLAHHPAHNSQHHPYASPPPAPTSRHWSATTNRYASKRPTTSSQYQQYYQPPQSAPRRTPHEPPAAAAADHDPHFHRYGGSRYPSPPPQPSQEYRTTSTPPPHNTASSHRRSWDQAPEAPSSRQRQSSSSTSPGVHPNFVNIHPSRGNTNPGNTYKNSRRQAAAGRGATYGTHHHHRGSTNPSNSYVNDHVPPPQARQPPEWKVDFDVQTERRQVVRPRRRGIMERIFHRRQHRAPEVAHVHHPHADPGAPPSVIVGQDLSVDVWIDRPTAIRGGVQTVDVTHQQDGEEIVRHITVTIPTHNGNANGNDDDDVLLPNGHMFYVASHGHPGPHNGPPGDLYIFLRVRDE